MSFSAEMKDFLNAYQSGQKINASRTDQDYKEQLTAKAKQDYDDAEDPDSTTNQKARADLAATLSSTKNAAANSASTRALQAEQLRQYKLQQQGGLGGGLLPPGAINPGSGGPQPSPQGAVPAATIQPDVYASGGLVPDDDEDDPEDVPAQTVGAVPINPINQDPRLPAPLPPGVAQAYASSRRHRGLNGIIAPQSVHDAALAGATYGAKEYGLHQTGALMTPAQQARAQMYAQGHGGLSDAELNAAKNAVDPEGKLTDSQRNMAALGSVYQYWNNKGDSDKAQRVAFQMLQSYRNAATRYSAIAAHAAAGGDLPLAAQAMMKAYAHVPDGKDVHIEVSPDDPKRLIYYSTDENGNDSATGIATPQELASSAMGLASGGFDKAILSAAGQREEAAAGGKGPKAPTIGDRDKLGKMLADPDSPLAQAKTADDAARTKAGQPPRDKYWSDIHAATTHAMIQNPEADLSEAYDAAHDLTSVNPDDPSPFKVKTDEDSGAHTLTFKNGLQMKLSPEKFDAIMNQRAAALKADDAKSDTEDDAADAPSWFQRRVAPVGGALADAASDAASAPATSQPVFPGGTSGAVPVDNAPAVPVSRAPPYVPFMAGGR